MRRRSWSYSRDNLLRFCERKLFFSYYAGARVNSSNPVKKELALLKQLKGIPGWAGDAVHTVIAEFLKALTRGQQTSREAAKERTVQIAEGQWNFSAEHQYLKTRMESAGEFYAALFEHEYNIPLPLDAKDRAIDKMLSLIENFYDLQESIGLSLALPRAVRYWIEAPAFGHGATVFEFEGVTVTVKVDLAFIDLSGNCHILDWKTGKSDNESFRSQMEVYILWPHLALNLNLDTISASAVNLQTREVTQFTLDTGAKGDRLEWIRDSIQAIDALLADPQRQIADIQDFNFARHVSICQRCPFQRVCVEWE